MPFVETYDIAAPLRAQAAYGGEYAVTAEDRRRYEQQIAEKQREFDYETALRSAALSQQGELQGRELSLRSAALGQQGQEMALRYDTDQQQIAAQQAYQGASLGQQAMNSQNATIRALAGDAAQMTRQQQAQQFQSFMSDRQAVMKAWPSLTEQQRQQAVEQVERAHGIPWGAPETLIQQNAQQEQEQQEQEIRSMLASPYGEGLIAPESFIPTLMQMEPEKRIAAIGKLQGEERQRHGQEIKAKEFERTQQFIEGEGFQEQERKTDAHLNDIDRDNQRADEELSRKARQAARQAKIDEAKDIRDARVGIAKERAAYRRDASRAFDAESKAALGPEPNWESMEQDAVSEIRAAYTSVSEPSSPTGGVQAAADDIRANGLSGRDPRLKPGEKIVTNAEGKQGILHADGSVTPI